ncbi:MAG TPA: aminotransferase class I/II-fold pyridoxal phosphate-dependent enzyme [Solirubrobacterales bacterium]|jgi:cystathionine beta-lyase|nr:aminotransferase class I/II-fold pyridoxal phosphate-dependent enzyme [Solirubrobacterales bacterium]
MSGAIDLSVPPLATLNKRASAKWSSQGDGVLAMTIAEMDFPLAAPVAAVLREAIERDDLGYAPADPVAAKRALAGFAERRLGWSPDPEQVAIVPDTITAVIVLCEALLRRGETIAMATPAYPPFFSILPRAGLEIAELPLDAAGELELGGLEEALAAGARGLLLVNPHNPSGSVASHERLGQVAELCAQHEAWVLADEIHAPLVLPGATHTPWLEVSDAAREFGFCLTSASKAFNLAGLKSAQIVTASARARAVVDRLPPLASAAGILGTLAAAAAFAEGDEWLDAVLAQLDANRRQLGDELAAKLPGVRWREPAGTYLAWLDFRSLGLGDDPAAALLERGRVALSPGPTYGGAGAGWARLNFATSPALLREGVERIATAVATS